MEIKRKPFQGVKNILNFNRLFFITAAAFIVATLLLSFLYTPFMYIAATISCLIIIPLIVSWYVYDASGLYKLKWLSGIDNKNYIILNISAGFDEINDTLNIKYPEATIIPLDFYDPEKHTEISIKIARRAYPPSEATIPINTAKLPFENNSINYIFLFLSAHEIRKSKERIHFFSELKQVLKPEGIIYVTEHLRDVNNFIAYNIGFFHFHSLTIWHKTFDESGLIIHKKINSTPFISTFALIKNGDSL